jgi:hypothetical protein
VALAINKADLVSNLEATNAKQVTKLIAANLDNRRVEFFWGNNYGSQLQ